MDEHNYGITISMTGAHGATKFAMRALIEAMLKRHDVQLVNLEMKEVEFINEDTHESLMQMVGVLVYVDIDGIADIPY